MSVDWGRSVFRLVWVFDNANSIGDARRSPLFPDVLREKVPADLSALLLVFNGGSVRRSGGGLVDPKSLALGGV